MAESMKLLLEGVRELDIHLTPRQVEMFQRFYQELMSWNERMNLTAIVDFNEAQVKHFLVSCIRSSPHYSKVSEKIGNRILARTGETD